MGNIDNIIYFNTKEVYKSFDDILDKNNHWLYEMYLDVFTLNGENGIILPKFREILELALYKTTLRFARPGSKFELKFSDVKIFGKIFNSPGYLKTCNVLATNLRFNNVSLKYMNDIVDLFNGGFSFSDSVVDNVMNLGMVNEKIDFNSFNEFVYKKICEFYFAYYVLSHKDLIQKLLTYEDDSIIDINLDDNSDFASIKRIGGDLFEGTIEGISIGFKFKVSLSGFEFVRSQY